MSLKDLQAIVDSGTKLTPMMDQYFQIKKNYPDTLLLFRMGDFYEVFFEDAKTTARLLNITLTHRGKIGDTPIPMAGIPHHAAPVYIDRITNRGLKVAICEQIQDPKDAVGIVKRGVTQVVSPGMPFDLEKTQGHDHRFMVSAFKKNAKYYLVALDFTTGDFSGYKHDNFEEFVENLRMLAPREFITFMGQWNEGQEAKDIEAILNHYDVLKTHLSEEYFNPKFTDIYIEKIIPGFKRDKIIKLDEDVLNPIGALAYYVCSTQLLENFIHIRPFKMTSQANVMKVTLPTLVGLEILPKSRETYRESLLGFFDKTETAMGARYLRSLFSNPLFDMNAITERLDIVTALTDNDSLIKDLKVELSKIRDIERILAKISMNKGSASDLLNLATAINSYTQILKEVKALPIKAVLAPAEIKKLSAIAEDITNTLNDEIGASLEKGNLIKEGVNKDRDRLAKLHLNVAEELLKMENRLKDETGILKLRIKSNNVSGFFIEVSKGSTVKVPKSFERRQTLVNAERYTTPDLIQLEKDTITAQTKLEKLEREIFKGLIQSVADMNHSVLLMSEHIAFIDSFQGLAAIALSEGFTRPNINEKKQVLNIKQGFHPLIKSLIKDQFVCHDLNLNQDAYFGLITGPNMAGKTTVMREVAIIQLLAQIGSFVPAKSAELGLCDFLFSRLGASDDILKGQSTFMVEMAETAEILRHASSKSLIILDEVGRGTSTYDGLSIAWGLVEHFIEKTKALTLFATHYHELIDVVQGYKTAKNLTVETINHNGNVQFLYRLIEQPASQSFGIYVAKLAGLPASVLARSEEILHQLEKNHTTPIAPPAEAMSAATLKPNKNAQLCFFDGIIAEVEIPEHLKQLEADLQKLDVMRMTPIDALLKLNEMKKNLEIQ
ncbi:DNA mismatch repair protein MutS [Bacteriovorax stolpii]|uniref:DNA mismatch repair protein MutS n=1 Tax=Bacteriovorax stolpii TaxID=960 RepID=A0A2K9NNU4_BACTC|nr:DNA mismatch repair protein MutS [Bacteriovorax stolpii]AUN97196.1 DNA mismatch repair protein MutS [Bacteriovorax stolpii]QDK42865.1 DNA mismatch repair protein MutS [Bacteriovorax stolpii]TDP53483.1 DNA mismatch repair protein MutS [Bacteriovorax stolpii]